MPACVRPGRLTRRQLVPLKIMLRLPTNANRARANGDGPAAHSSPNGKRKAKAVVAKKVTPTKAARRSADGRRYPHDYWMDSDDDDLDLSCLRRIGSLRLPDRELHKKWGQRGFETNWLAKGGYPARRLASR